MSSEAHSALPFPRRWGRRLWGFWTERWALGEMLALAVCPLILLLSAVLSERWQLHHHVMPGVVLEGEPVGGYSAEALGGLIQRRAEPIERRLLTLQVGAKTFKVGAPELGAKTDREELLGAILGEGRSGPWLRQLWWRAERFTSNKTFKLSIVLDETVWEARLKSLEKQALSLPEEGSFEVSDGKLIRNDPKAGQLIDRVKAKAVVLEALSRATAPGAIPLPLRDRAPRISKAVMDATEDRLKRMLSQNIRLLLDFPEGSAPTVGSSGPGDVPPILELKPSEFGHVLRGQASPNGSEILIEVDAPAFEDFLIPYRTKWEQPAQDARFNVGPQGSITIEPSRVQTRIDAETAARELIAAADSPERTGTWPLKHGDPPRITTELAHTLGITQKVGSFTTRHPCCQPRVNNIHRMADLMDGVVVLPGESFSINEHIGPRTAHNGFADAPTIVRGEIEDTVGGGVSQFATTIFNAVLRAGYEILERQPHSFYFTRYPAGHEATLSYPKPDFIFKNDTASGVLIKTAYSGTYIKVTLYGDKEGRKVTRDVSKRYDFVDPPVEYEIDDTLPPDEEKVLESGQAGWSIDVSRTVITNDGNKKTDGRKVVYNPRPRRLRVHSCRVPEEDEGFTGIPCPLPIQDAGAP